MEKTNWFAGCDTFDELTEAFRKKHDELLYGQKDPRINNLTIKGMITTLTNQYIMILENNYDIKRKGANNGN